MAIGRSVGQSRRLQNNLILKRMQIHQKSHKKMPPSLRKTVIERVITMTIIKPIPNALTEVIQRDIRMAMLATDQKKRKDSGSIKHWASIL